MNIGKVKFEMVTTICFLNFKCDSNLSGLRQLEIAVGTQ